MNRLRFLVLALIIVMSPLSVTAKPKKKDAGPVLRADQADGDAGQVSAGEAAYTMCASCHGPEGDGQTGLAPRLNSQTFLAAVSNDFLTETIRDGRPGSNMVPWYGGLGDATLRNIVAYLRSWQTGGGYAAGVDGIGIGRTAFLDEASDGFIRYMIRNGKSGTLMTSFSKAESVAVDELTDEQVDSIILFLRENAW